MDKMETYTSWGQFGKKKQKQKKNPLVSMQQCLEPFNPYVVDVRRATKSSSS